MDWKVAGGKTAAYRQIGNAFPPPVAQAVGNQIREALYPSAETQCSPIGTAMEHV